MVPNVDYFVGGAGNLRGVLDWRRTGVETEPMLAVEARRSGVGIEEAAADPMPAGTDSIDPD